MLPLYVGIASRKTEPPLDTDAEFVVGVLPSVV
jgi:hypothetical protein